MTHSWSPHSSTLAWAAGPWAFWCARFVCALRGHRWATCTDLYGEHSWAMPWAGECRRCGVTYGDVEDGEC